MALIPASSLGRHAAGAPEVQVTALLAKGFRPFFLLAGVFAAVSIPVWLTVLHGRLELGAYAGALSWHAHEMLFGFTTAVIAGFLLTAVANWTGKETVRPGSLLLLVGLWALGRAAMSGAARLPPVAVAALDAVFLPALAVTLAIPLFATRNRRNYPVLGLVTGLALANGAFHWATLSGATGIALRSLLVTVDVVVLLIGVIGGRVIPGFTRNATRLDSIRSSPLADRVALGGLLLVALADALALSDALLASALAFAGVASWLRIRHWGARHAGKEPLLWVLHLGHAWVPVGLLLRAILVAWGASPFPALHALTVGAVGTLTLGMMSRVSLGHTGRLLRAPPSATAAFILVSLSALVRVGGPLVLPAAPVVPLTISGVLWSVAFALFVLGYARILASPRVDGKAG